MLNCTWTNGKKTITGSWTYSPEKEEYTIYLDRKNRNIIHVNFPKTWPEWGNWKLVQNNSLSK